jgi:hypothetical protein
MLSFEKEKSLQDKHDLIIVNNNGTSSIKKREEYVFNIF